MKYRSERNAKMKCLIVEDDSAACKLLQTYLSDYCDCFIAVNGHEAVESFREALKQGQPYDLICLDIMMPEMDGHDALKAIRRIEKEQGIIGLDGVKVVMITALDDSKNVMGAFKTGCESYIVKPVKKEKLFEEIEKLGLIKSQVN
jgi:two-component system chemotaxis response regulator CheY